MKTRKNLAILVCIVIAVAAMFLGDMQHVMGAPMIGLIIGMIIVNVMPSVDKEFKAGTTFVGKKFLTIGIILAGGTLNFADVIGIGSKALPLIIFNILLSFTIAFVVGKKLGVSKNTSTLVGGGTCICGGTAIATLSRIIKAHEDEIAYAMTAIFLFDALAAFSYPYLANFLQLTDNQFAFLAGTAINDTSSVAAAQSTYVTLHGLGDWSGALTVKLARTTMLIFVAVFWTVFMAKKETAENKNGSSSIMQTILKVFPWFIVWFLVMAILNTLGLFNGITSALNLEGSFAVGKLLSKGYKFFITCALAGVGFKIQFKDIFTKGMKPVILGGCTWLAVAASSLIFIQVFTSYVG